MTDQNTRTGLLDDPRWWAMSLSLGAAVLMLGGKLWAWQITGSAAIFSDAAESVIHFLAIGFAAFSLWYQQQPPDRTHPYGHGKIEYFSAGFEGSLILMAAGVIAYAAIEDLIRGPELEQLDLGLLITAGLSGVNLALGLYLVHVGRRENSLVLRSNGHHVLTDMWTSVGVVGGVGLVWLTDVVWLDPVVALAVAANILWTAMSLLREGIAGLMETARTEDTRRIVEVLNRALEEDRVAGYHQVRHRRVGDQLWVEYHLLFPEALSITEAHERSNNVEAAVDEQFPEHPVHVTAHLEPREHEQAHPEGHREPADPLRGEEEE